MPAKKKAKKVKKKKISKADRFLFEQQIAAFELYCRAMKDHLSKQQYIQAQEFLLSARLLLAQEEYNWVYNAIQDLLWWLDELESDAKPESELAESNDPNRLL
jgi:hypothetical protein